ncbi:hypothetical protein Si119_00118 [Streptococcus infantarius subsp. infantarius]|nr:hypothetical protein [Streptococcus infantarius subsp. infantarius]
MATLKQSPFIKTLGISEDELLNYLKEHQTILWLLNLNSYY